MKFRKAVELISDGECDAIRRADMVFWPEGAKVTCPEENFLMLDLRDYHYPWVPTLDDVLADDWEIA